MTKYTTMTDYPVRKTNHCYDLDRCLVEWELIQHRLGDKLWDSDKGLGTGIYSNYNRQTSIQRSTQSPSERSVQEKKFSASVRSAATPSPTTWKRWFS